MDVKIAALFTLPLLLFTSTASAQGARYEDDIERMRKKYKKIWKAEREAAEEEKKNPKKKVIPKDIFGRWDARLEKPKKPRVTFHADASITGNDINRWQDSDAPKYKTLEDLRNFYLNLPPPPPNISITPGQPLPPTGPGAASFYTAILQFINAGPNGSAVTLAHLQQITPAFMQLGAIAVNAGNLSQLLNSPQAFQLLQAAQGILQPLGLWNVSTLNSWINYILPRQGQLFNIVTTLYYNLLNISPPTSPGNGPPIVVTNPINTGAILAELFDLLTSRDWRKDWAEIAERAPDLVHGLIKHLGFSKPQIVLYGSRRTRFHRAGIITERRRGGDREVHVFNEEGYFVNDRVSGIAGRYYQGLDDFTLTYFPVEVKNGRVNTLDAIASDRFALLKRMSGGNTKLLDRTTTHSTALLSLDVAFTESQRLHARFVGGTTPYSSMGGVMGNIEYGSGFFKGRIGGGAVMDNAYFADSDTFVGYVETENEFKTPALKFVSKDKQRGVRTWSSLTLAASGMAHFAMKRPVKQLTGERLPRKWGLQADIRAIPEIHLQLGTPFTLWTVSGGLTAGIVPGGHVELKKAERSLSLYPLRSHIEASCRLDISEIIREDTPTLTASISLEFRVIGEFSQLLDKGRFENTFEYNGLKVNAIGELIHYKDGPFTDIYLGGGIGYLGAFVRALKSLNTDDYRIEAGISLGLFDSEAANKRRYTIELLKDPDAPERIPWNRPNVDKDNG